jgi:hypothetical protein
VYLKDPSTEYKKAFPHPKIRNEFIIIKWSKGYKLTEIWFHDRLLKSIEGIRTLLRKVVFDDYELGKVEVFLSKDPYVINLKVDNIHSSLNSEHPKKNVKAIGNWMLPGLLVHFFWSATLIFNGFTEEFQTYDDKIGMVYNSVLFLCFLISFVLILLKHPSFYILGFVAYFLQAILLLYVMILFNYLGVLSLTLVGLYLVYCGVMILPLKRVIAYIKHKPYDFIPSEEVLDN